MNSFAKRLEALLEEKDMKQNELAKRIGVSEVTISRYMTKERKPRTDIATKISKELGVSTDYLLGEDNIRIPYQENNKESKEDKLVTDPLLEQIRDLSPESIEELEKYMELLKIKEQMDKCKDETSSALEKEA